MRLKKNRKLQRNLLTLQILFIFRIVALFYYNHTRDAVAMKNEIDMRNVLLGTFNNPIVSILL